MTDKKKVYTDEKDMPLAAISQGDMRWNRTGSWRNVRPFYDPKTSPCIAGCPAGENIQGYIELVRQERYEEAAHLIWESNPFPSVCGRVCYHPCMNSCMRAEFDEAVFIPAIERFIGDYAIEHNVRPKAAPKKLDGNIAVVGGGPAGLSCAFYLARMGYGVTIFEAKEELGGVLRYGIPEYRLPKDVLEAEVSRVLDLGVDVKTGVAVGKEVSLEDLGSFDAYFIGVGLQKSRALGIDKEDIEGVMAGLSLLEAVNRGEEVELGEKVVVIGGGNTAMDVARTAMRRGAEVTVVYRRTRAEMPAIEDEVNEAIEEGVAFKFLAAPSEIISVDGRINAIVCQEMELGEPDDSGRRRPVPREGAFFTLPTDSLLVAAGELPDTGGLESALNLDHGYITADDTARTSRKGVFAGGDIVTGAATVVEAVARGRVAAEVIREHLGGEAFHPRAYKKLLTFDGINPAYFERTPTTPMPRLRSTDNQDAFAEVNLGMGSEQLQSEAARCFSCGVCDACDNCFVFCPDVAISREDGVYVIDYNFCKGCLICSHECPRGVLSTESEAG